MWQLLDAGRKRTTAGKMNTVNSLISTKFFFRRYNLGQNKWEIKTTPPRVSMMEKMARFG